MGVEKGDAGEEEKETFVALFAMSAAMLGLSIVRTIKYRWRSETYWPLLSLYVIFCAYSLSTPYSVRALFFADIWLAYSFYLYSFLQYAPTTLQFAAEVLVCYIW